MNPLELVSEIYRLLSNCDEQDFAAAERLETARGIRSVLGTMRRTKRDLVLRVETGPRSRTAAKVRRASGGSPESWALSVARVADAAGVSVEQLARLLRRSGFQIEAQGKETRLSLLRRAERTAQRYSDEERVAAFGSLVKLLSKSETEGWMDVIGSTKRR